MVAVAVNVAGVAKDGLRIGRLAPRVLPLLLLTRGIVMMALDVELVKLLVNFLILLLLFWLAAR